MSNLLPPTDWGQRYRELRTARDLTQAEVAARADCAQHTVSQLENGTFRPDLDLQLRLADAIESTVTEAFPRTQAEADLAVRCSGGH